MAMLRCSRERLHELTRDVTQRPRPARVALALALRTPSRVHAARLRLQRHADNEHRSPVCPRGASGNAAVNVCACVCACVCAGVCVRA
jgi:hypothetical protein